MWIIRCKRQLSAWGVVFDEVFICHINNGNKTVWVFNQLPYAGGISVQKPIAVGIRVL